MLTKDLNKLCGFYEKHLKETLLPFWLKNGIDYKYGGFFTCFDNRGENLVSTDKYIWSQGRAVWLFSKLSGMSIFKESEKSEFKNIARLGARFLQNSSLSESFALPFVVDRAGNSKTSAKGNIYTSIFADCFALLGLTKYASLTNNDETLDFVKKLYNSVTERIDSGKYETYPNPVPKGYKLHGIRMIMLNICDELSRLLKKSDENLSTMIEKRALNLIEDILGNFVTEDYLLHEYIRNDNSFDNQTVVGRLINPGHTLEDMWFMIHFLMDKGKKDILDKVIKISKKAFETGWDDKYSGLFHHVDQEGGKTKGALLENEDKDIETKFLNDWSNKLWWVHSESLYTSILCYYLTNDNYFIEIYEKIHKYTFKTFPHPDRKIGEWIQIRDRFGQPEDKVVALPVKDPFHIIRNVIHIITLLKEDRQDYIL